MMLAIADFADDDGRAYPGVPTLARKTRMSERNVRLILAELKKSGELHIRANEGPRGTNLYRITLPLKRASALNASSPLKPASATPEAGFRKPLKPASAEPSVNHHEPSDMADKPLAASEAAGHCPHQAIIDLYEHILPAGRRVRAWNATRKAKLRARWNEEPKRQSLQWWRSLFEYVAKSDFLTGKTHTPGRKPFEIDLEWIVTASNFVKIIEGKYENQEATA